ncbi:MAG TPA: phosphopentomutase [Firmicutes bacterium]|nr:phosphopentomutase [Bacillota bacterium]
MQARAILLVLDSVGVGELPDAAEYGDVGSNTLGNTAKAVGALRLPNLERLGLGNIIPIQGVRAVTRPLASYGKMTELSAGKDTTTGHWELCGIVSYQPFPTYPQGFPPQVITAITAATGYGVLGNKAASGTEIIQELGTEHMATGKLIVYTSADSVLQIAAHEQIVPLDELYRVCTVIRELMQGEHGVGRVIARPFVGEPGGFTRTPNRRDFSLEPPQDTILDKLTAAGYPVWAVGKIEDIFAGRGINRAVHTKNNQDTVNATLTYMRELQQPGLIFANLVDFDMLWGHRNDPQGYARGLEAFDARLSELLQALLPDDLLLIVADHGCDPTTDSTDHSREYVPLLAYRHNASHGDDLGIRSTFADVAASLAALFQVDNPGPGVSFL